MKHLMVIGCLKSKRKVLLNGNMPLRKKIQEAELEAEFVKYVSLIVNSGAVPNGSKIKHNGLNN